MKKIFALLAVFALSSILFAQKAGKKISFDSVDLKGNAVTDSIFQENKITMLNIWGTFCGPCIKEMPDLAILSKKYDEEKFQIIGIVIDAVNRKGLPDSKTIEAAKSIVKQTGADYFHIVPDIKLQNGILLDVFAVPTTIFVDKNGNLIGEIYTGSRSLADWQKIIDKLLQ